MPRRVGRDFGGRVLTPTLVSPNQQTTDRGVARERRGWGLRTLPQTSRKQASKGGGERGRGREKTDSYVVSRRPTNDRQCRSARAQGSEGNLVLQTACKQARENAGLLLPQTPSKAKQSKEREKRQRAEWGFLPRVRGEATQLMQDSGSEVGDVCVRK